MSRVNIPLSCCCEGDIVAVEVLNDNGVVLVAVNTIINQYIKNKLAGLGISSIWVYRTGELPKEKGQDNKDLEMEENYKSIVLEVKQVIHGLTAGKALDFEKVQGISEQILGSINESSHVINCLTKIRDADEYTYTHSVNVAFYSMLIGKWMHMAHHQIMELTQVGLLHDIGKTMIPGEILNKKGKLTSEEFVIMKRHSVYGYNLVENMKELSRTVKLGILMHHERNDGTGYPYGLSGDEIEMYAKIVSIADVYDAMTQNRVYKKRATPFDAFEMFMTTGIVAFDTSILKVFLYNLSAQLTGAIVELDNGETGEIVYVPPQAVTSPIVQVKSNFLDLSQERDIKLVGIK